MTLIPDAALESHVAILGKTGSGKSNLAKVLAERLMYAGARVCVLDPTGTWCGTRLDQDGRKPSPFKPVIFGGAHGDLALSEQHGAVLGEAIGTSADSCILDVQQMTVGQRTRFATAFAEALLRFNRGPLHLIIDEAHLFAPQGRVNDPQSGAMLHAFNNLVSLGRGRGLRIMLISQRPAKIHKDSLTQAETLIAMRLIAPQDRSAVKDWIGEWADGGADIIASLPSLPTGEGWVWSPQSDYLKRTKFPLAITFDSGRPEANAEMRDLPPINTAALGEKMDAIRQEAMENDPRRLRARIAELEREKARIPDVTEVTQEQIDKAFDAGRRDGYSDGHIDGYAEGIKDTTQNLGKKVLDFAADFALATAQPMSTPTPKVQMAAKPAPIVAKAPAIVAPKAAPVASGMSPSSVKLVDAIVAAYPVGMTLETAAKRAGLSKRSSAFSRYLREAATSPRITARGDGRYVAVAAEEGLQAPSGLDDFKRSLPPSYARMLEAVGANAIGMDKDSIADAAGVSRTSSGLGAGLKELLALGLIEEENGLYGLSKDFV